ncbi:MAG: hypothetical protein NT169_26100 [Chloroflexi bacterium]|nr:hypothetical protein [Chloroflexota bacterium]
MHPNLCRRVPAGEIIKPWLILGPFYEDLSATVQGLTLFEKPGATVGRAAMTQIVGDAQTILRSRPVEGEETTFRGQAMRWELVRGPENYLSWGRYNISNHLGAAFLTTILTPDQPGVHEWRLIIGITSRAIVAINGTAVYDTDAHPVKQADGIFEYRFEAALLAGENIVTVTLFRLGRMAQIGCRLEAAAGMSARVPLAASMPAEARAGIEAQIGSIRLGRDVFYGEHEIGLRLGVAPDAAAPLTVSLCTESEETLRAVQPSAAGPIVLCRGDELADGHYGLLCSWAAADSRPLTAASFAIHKLTPAPALPGYEQLAERKRRVLAHYAGFQRAEHRPDIWCEVARYALGRYAEVDEAVIRDTCQFIAARKDCADFVIQGILRLMCWEREQPPGGDLRETPQLSPQIHAMMKDTVLGFKYWVDEPGDTVMYMGSENHRLLFHVAEWLAGKLFPTEEFTNSHMRGLYHATKGLSYITEWLRQRGRFGFDEWHSNSYYPVNIAPLINVYDFASHEGEQKLRQMTGLVLDYVFFNLAADSFEGVFGTTHGRSYGINLKYPDFEGTSATCWLLYGVGSLSWGTDGMSPVSLATSEYRAPRILADIATDKQAVVESKVRQGIIKGAAHHADFVVYRTPDYMVSAVQDLRKGEFESSTHVAQVTLGNKTTVFWSCPHTSGEGSGLRPDYWSGHTTLPRAIQYRNVLALTWRLTWRAWMSHCFFEQERFDEVRFAGNWAFGRVGRGYVGIYSQHGFVVGDEGQYAGRELQCAAVENTWLVECGREADWGSFDAFVNALVAAPVEAKDGVITYTSPSVGKFVTGWDVKPTINSEPIQIHGYPLVDSPWAHADFGSGELTIRHGDDEYEIWFNQ